MNKLPLNWVWQRQTPTRGGTKKCSREEALEQKEEENELQEIQPYGLYIIKLS